MNDGGEVLTRLFSRQRSGAMIATESQSTIDFVARGGENAGHREALGVAL
jgi:hypothetical protein